MSLISIDFYIIIYLTISSNNIFFIIGKKLNHTLLQNDLREQLYNVSSPVDKLTCHNNEEQEIPCPNGCCELISNGEFGFTRKCIVSQCGADQKVTIEQHVIGEPNVESTFSYKCNKPMCNDKKNAEKVRDLLKRNWLLTPTGVEPDPPNTAGNIFSQTSIVIQCLLAVTMIVFFKYN